MPLSSIVQVLLRLFALHWFVSGLAQLVAFISSQRTQSFSVVPLAVPVILLFAGVLFWAAAPLLSRAVARGADKTASLEGVTLRALYSTAFVGIGMWFALANFARVFNWIHRYISYPSDMQGMTDLGPGSFYDLSQPAMTLLAGVVVIVTAPILARKLTKDVAPSE